MSIYRLENTKLTSINEISISLERDIQKITEDNLETLFGLKLIKSEFQLHNLRIDSLAFDEENPSFVIIEYKKGTNYSVIDQGFSYLSLMLNNKADFILEYNDRVSKPIKREDVDWSQSKVVFVSPSFGTYQLNAINFRNLPFELWEVKKYEKDMYSYTEIRASEQSEDIENIIKDPNIEKVTKEVKVYTVDGHFPEKRELARELFDVLRERVIGLNDSMQEVPTKYYIAYKVPYNGKLQNILEVVPLASGLKLYFDISKSDLTDPEKIVKDCEKVGHWATGDSVLNITNTQELDYAMYLIKQVYDKFIKEKN